jgi:hypothetical protein
MIVTSGAVTVTFFFLYSASFGFLCYLYLAGPACIERGGVVIRGAPHNMSCIRTAFGV